MNVLVTGAYGRCGTAIIDQLHDDPDYEFTYLDRNLPDESSAHGGYDTVVTDVIDGSAVREVATGQDAMIHLAGYPSTDGTWDDVHQPNIVGVLNALEAAREAELETIIFASTNHVQGMYEVENAPELYFGTNAPVRLSPDDPVRPDSYYGVTKSFGEDLCRYYVENYEYPKRAHAIRICSVRMPAYDHPYGDAERGVDDGEYERHSDEYERRVARMKSMWQSRRDFGHMIDCCLGANDDGFQIFNGVSDNDRRWFSTENAQKIGYDPQDNGDEWDSPPV